MGAKRLYKKIIDTHLTATVSGTTEEAFNPDQPLQVFVPQYRTIRSATDVHSETDNDTGVQTSYLRNKDREFSVLVQWTGQMAVTAIRMAVDPDPDYMEGLDYQDEYLARRLTAEGTGGIGNTLPPANAPTGQVMSKFISPLKPRWVEFPAYDSAVPNGVFFVAELTAAPPPDDYPLNHFPVTVNFTSETPAIDIYFTTDGSTPRGAPDPHGTLYGPSSRPHVALNQTLKARGFKDGLRPSPLLSGRYTQSQCGTPVFDPDGGSFPPDQFPDPNQTYIGPVGSYNFDEGNGTVAHDVGPYSLDATCVSTTWNPTGKHGKAITFNGTSSYLYLPNDNHFRMGGPMTLSAWVRATADPTSDAGIISKFNGVSGWELRTTKDTGVHRFCVQVSSSSHTFAKRHSTTIRLLNTWYHVAGVFDPSDNTLKMYDNGVLENGTIAGFIPSAQTYPNVAPNIGRSCSGVSLFTGSLDDVKDLRPSTHSRRNSNRHELWGY